jgi:hypothetical protein
VTGYFDILLQGKRLEDQDIRPVSEPMARRLDANHAGGFPLVHRPQFESWAR